MSKMKSAISLTACFGLLAATGWWSLVALPLPAAPAARLQETEPAAGEPVPVGGHVMASKLIHGVDPKYPLDLERASPLGRVILSAVIGKNGEVQQVEVLRGDKGHPALNSASMDAVRQWRYEPFTLDGKPVPVRTTVIVRFPPHGIHLQVSGETNQIRREMERALADIQHALSEMVDIDFSMIHEKETRREMERAVKGVERAVKGVERAVKGTERAMKRVDSVRSEMKEPENLKNQESGNSNGP